MTSPTFPPDRTHPPTPACQVSHLLRREIQAPIAAALIRGFAQTLGMGRALEIAAAAVRADALVAGREMAARPGGGSLSELERLVREVWSADDAMTVRILERTERTLSFDVTRCGYAELYERLGGHAGPRVLPVLQPRRALRPRVQPAPCARAHPDPHAGRRGLRFPVRPGVKVPARLPRNAPCGPGGVGRGIKITAHCH